MKQIDIGQVDATFRNIALSIGLVIESVVIKAQNAKIETDPFRFTLPEPGDVTVTVTQEAIESHLETMAPGGLRDFRVALISGQVLVEATARVILDIRAKAVCTLRIVDGTQLFVDLQDVDVLGGSAKKLVENQLSKVNPILDASELPLSLVMEEIVVEDGRVTIYGKASPPA